VGRTTLVVKPRLAAARFVPGDQQDGLPLRIECKGGTPLTILHQDTSA
jgi:hypothetical protein